MLILQQLQMDLFPYNNDSPFHSSSTPTIHIKGNFDACIICSHPLSLSQASLSLLHPFIYPIHLYCLLLYTPPPSPSPSPSTSQFQEPFPISTPLPLSSSSTPRKRTVFCRLEDIVVDGDMDGEVGGEVGWGGGV